jgi:Ca-activated chloride channel homolog
MSRAGKSLAAAGLTLTALTSWAVIATPAQERPVGQGFSFRTGVELVNVTATVVDEHGHFVPGLRAEDFELFEDGRPQAISQFEAERVPVSLGIALDTSGSMLGEKIVAAQAALNRFLFDLLGSQDEVFLYRIEGRPDLVQGWTEDRKEISRELGSVKPSGGTALYDTVSEAIPLAQAGTRRKKALVIISDGNDTASRTHLAELRQLIRQTEVLVYAIGIDASGDDSAGSRPSQQSTRQTIPTPSPFPGRKPAYTPPPPTPRPSPRRASTSSVDRINADALRNITDDSGGRTEIIVSPRDLDPTTAGIADELSRQYFLGYSSSAPRDGRWHTIEVRLRKGSYTVRARRGFISN